MFSHNINHTIAPKAIIKSQHHITSHRVYLPHTEGITSASSNSHNLSRKHACQEIKEVRCYGVSTPLQVKSHDRISHRNTSRTSHNMGFSLNEHITHLIILSTYPNFIPRKGKSNSISVIECQHIHETSSWLITMPNGNHLEITHHYLIYTSHVHPQSRIHHIAYPQSCLTII